MMKPLLVHVCAIAAGARELRIEHSGRCNSRCGFRFFYQIETVFERRSANWNGRRGISFQLIACQEVHIIIVDLECEAATDSYQSQHGTKRILRLTQALASGFSS